MDVLVKGVKLKKYFPLKNGTVHAVDGVDIEIGRGRTLGVVGESGCGKSTLGRLMLRLIEPTEGQLFFEGENILDFNKKQMEKVRREIQIIFQDPYSSLNPRLSVFELIAEPLIVNKVFKSRKEVNDRILYLMEKVGLATRFINSYPHELDGGRRQRIGVARALSLNPKFIVCDEPVSALDVSIQAQILNLLMDIQQEMDLTYMFITHDLSVVRHISDDIAVMYLGQCVERAPSKELFSNPLHPYTKALLKAIPTTNLNNKLSYNIVKGEVSNPIDPKPGCRFAPRCELCTDECIISDFELKEVKPNHFVACRLYE